METYVKINSLFKRDASKPKCPIILGEWAQPEFEYLKDNQWQFTEKVDGTNIRVVIQHGKVTFKGKTDAAQIPAKLVDWLRNHFDQRLEHLTYLFPEGACLYGEGYGAGIQKGGGNYSDQQQFVLFDVKIGPWWLRRPDIETIAESLALPIVPVIGQGTLADMVERVRDGIESKWGRFEAEGIVARPVVELVSRSGQRIIAKLKTRDFATLLIK